LLSQAEHGADSQVVLISIAWSEEDITDLQAELHKQATALPRCEVIRQSIGHSSIINAPTIDRAMELSNQYAPEHLILQITDAAKYVDLVNNAGSVFVGALSPESCGDYTSGTNHTLPTYGYANQYSGVNTDTYLKYITSQELSTEGLESIGNATVVLAEREGLQGHANAVKVRLAEMKRA
ncbi:histidinol dehydrogenase, partial [Macrococcus caseolyticus]